MIDNKRVKDSHQEGIKRVLQRKGDMMKGQGGKMHNAPEEEANWKRSGSNLTPRRA
ncbi:MAG TPA: hypothetical protein VHZ50_02790 [Puia sp.]|jgi:hypothetical protein|nr:hypothetical protein [Puia sp.]